MHQVHNFMEFSYNKILLNFINYASQTFAYVIHKITR